jgi:hypothetical protein
MQAIIVDCKTIINPQFASIVRYDAEPVVATPEDSHTTSPACSKMITSRPITPSATSVLVVHFSNPTSFVWSATAQIRAPATLTEVELILHEKTMAVDRAIIPTSTP